MQKATTVLGLVLTLILFSCTEAPKEMGDFNLLPLPQQFAVTGVSDLESDALTEAYSADGAELPILGKSLTALRAGSGSGAPIQYGVDESLDLPAQGYTLDITEDRITIKGKDTAGLFYAFRSLEQLVIDAQDQGVNLPICSISDFPALAYRAIQLDVKHHLETTEYYYDLIDKLATQKINGIIIEIEDKLKYVRQARVGSADALSIEEWRKISDYAKDRFIEISPLVQGLGHSSFVLKHDTYKVLRDDPESDWAYNPLNPETYKVQFDLYLDAMEAFPHGKYLHVGGDEVHTTGRNSGKSALELQLDWLSKVSAFAESHNRTPIFWDDMPLKQAGVYNAMFNKELTETQVDSIWAENEHKLLAFLDKFPKNCIYMRWNYSASEAVGNQKAMDWFRSKDLPVMGATAGQTRWVMMPQEESNWNNIRNFAVSSIESGLDGLLLTLWDDDSPHFELYMRGILGFSEYAWSGEKRDKDALKKAFRHRQYGNVAAADEYAFIDALEAPVAFWKNALLVGNSRNYISHSDDPKSRLIELPTGDGSWAESEAERLARAKSLKQVHDSLGVSLAALRQTAVRNSYNLEVYEQVYQVTGFTLDLLLTMEAYDLEQEVEKKNVLKKSLLDKRQEFKELRAQFEKVYAQTRKLNKPDDYILDQDGHHHLANQSRDFSWQFLADELFLESLETNLVKVAVPMDTEVVKP
ncbi:family 20 glycosylhydrolase [Sediminicola luteus]|uniref:beta-N-acetylhexosaminidase n=1 Tax=Sediminicola luteus TaxID=319238 RepID=A0A2A4G8Y8_9FLAO|nr:family 20 glycosylhydrolase [Sediminicola luteus]PCE64448.1 glycoside hydrolase family 20 [Sediminicola luteus]